MSPILSGLGGITVKGYGHFGPVRVTDTGAMFPLQVITVGPGDVASVSFTNIPQTYTHLQVRALWQGTSNPKVAFNGDTTNTNYYRHYVGGNGASVYVGADNTNTYFGYMDSVSTNVFCANVMDILDYANTNKYKTMRTLAGNDRNCLCVLFFYSGLWKSTSAITSMTFTLNDSTNFRTYSQFALYGVKSA